jgi:hypothetical protein
MEEPIMITNARLTISPTASMTVYNLLRERNLR